MYKYCDNCANGGDCVCDYCLGFIANESGGYRDRDEDIECDFSDEELAAIADDETRLENEGGIEND